MTQISGKTRTILLIAGGVFLIFLLWYFSAIVTYILISVFLSFLGRPLVGWLTLIRYKKFYIPKGIAAFIALIAIWAIFFLFFRFMVPLLIKELETLYKELELHLDGIYPLTQVQQHGSLPLPIRLPLLKSSPIVMVSRTRTVLL